MKFFSFLRRKEKKEETLFLLDESDFSLCTKQTIDDTVGENGTIIKKFNEMTSYYDPDENPLSKEKAYEIMENLMQTAVTNRLLLCSRISKSIESGSMFEQYYQKLHIVNTLTNSAHIKMQRMRIAEKNYNYLLSIYNKVLEKSYVSSFVPSADTIPSPDQEDAWDYLRTSGGFDHETDNE